eukprot:CAMPEP_0196777126 /NCGR_PEP_ID=MMETSP1104-20130614/5040_1 /TAXON_ID=33652 /ORGANISM="Cafeteria sp., Strain Caron Lab Isolate" /LENGTH=151 /DNA_ID=CAMNT_0042147293 /DNA_START=36 /DNA_END=487 /DNA_ORIENTATION=+
MKGSSSNSESSVAILPRGPLPPRLTVLQLDAPSWQEGPAGAKWSSMKSTPEMLDARATVAISASESVATVALCPCSAFDSLGKAALVANAAAMAPSGSFLATPPPASRPGFFRCTAAAMRSIIRVRDWSVRSTSRRMPRRLMVEERFVGPR